MNSEVPISMNQNVLTLVDSIAIISSLSSLILAIIAIWLTLSFKRDADKTNAETSKMLIEVRSESKNISNNIMSELKAYGDSMRNAFYQNNTSTDSTSNSSVPKDFSVDLNTSDRETTHDKS